MYRPLSLHFSTYVIAFVLFFVGCVSRDEPRPSDCENSDLTIVSSGQTNPTGCTTNNGQIIVAASGGLEPYEFALDNGVFASSSEFSGLGAGVFTLHVKDAKGCEQSVEVALTVPGATLSALISGVVDNQCLTDNGALNVTASGGFPPYHYKIGTAAFGSNSSFSNLKNGAYVITVKDDSGCSLSLSTTVVRGNTGISYSAEVKEILTAKCATSSCHAGNQNPNLSILSTLHSSAANVKSRIISGSMPPFPNTALTPDEKSKIICWIEDGSANN